MSGISGAGAVNTDFRRSLIPARGLGFCGSLGVGNASGAGSVGSGAAEMSGIPGVDGRYDGKFFIALVARDKRLGCGGASGSSALGPIGPVCVRGIAGVVVGACRSKVNRLAVECTTSSGVL